MIRAFAQFVDNEDGVCMSDDQIEESLEVWRVDVRELFLRALRDELLGRFTDKQRDMLKALNTWLNPSSWVSVEAFIVASFGTAELDFLHDELSEVHVYSDGLNRPVKVFCFVSKRGLQQQLESYKMIAIGIARQLQEAADLKRKSQAASSQSSTSVASSFTNPVLRATDQVYHAVTGHSIVSDSCVTASSFKFSSNNSIRNSAPARTKPFPDVTMDKFIEAFHQRDDHLHYKDFCVLMQIALTLIIHTTSNERAFSLLHNIMTNLRNRITVPLLDALMRIKQWPTDLTDDDFNDFVEYWYKLKTRRVKINQK